MLLGIIDDFELDVDTVAVDAYQSRWFANKLEDLGLEVVEFSQSRANFSEPMKQLEAIMIEGFVTIDRNPVTSWMLRNCANSVDEHNNYFPKKSNDRSKIDGVVAMIMAIGVCGVFEEDDDFFDL